MDSIRAAYILAKKEGQAVFLWEDDGTLSYEQLTSLECLYGAKCLKHEDPEHTAYDCETADMREYATRVATNLGKAKMILSALYDRGLLTDAWTRADMEEFAYMIGKDG